MSRDKLPMEEFYAIGILRKESTSHHEGQFNPETK
jgi:hypothetical protein